MSRIILYQTEVLAGLARLADNSIHCARRLRQELGMLADLEIMEVP